MTIFTNANCVSDASWLEYQKLTGEQLTKTVLRTFTFDSLQHSMAQLYFAKSVVIKQVDFITACTRAKDARCTVENCYRFI